jgi:hypothetical protein
MDSILMMMVGVLYQYKKKMALECPLGGVHSRIGSSMTIKSKKIKGAHHRSTAFINVEAEEDTVLDIAGAVVHTVERVVGIDIAGAVVHTVERVVEVDIVGAVVHTVERVVGIDIVGAVVHTVERVVGIDIVGAVVHTVERVVGIDIAEAVVAYLAVDGRVFSLEELRRLLPRRGLLLLQISIPGY